MAINTSIMQTWVKYTYIYLIIPHFDLSFRKMNEGTNKGMKEIKEEGRKDGGKEGR